MFPGQPGNGGHGGERLAFARLHFGDFAVGKGERAGQLGVVHAQAENPLGCASHDRYGLNQIAGSRGRRVPRPMDLWDAGVVSFDRLRKESTEHGEPSTQ